MIREMMNFLKILIQASLEDFYFLYEPFSKGPESYFACWYGLIFYILTISKWHSDWRGRGSNLKKK